MAKKMKPRISSGGRKIGYMGGWAVVVGGGAKY